MYFKLWLCISLGVVGLGFSCPALCCPSAFTKSKAKKTFVSKEVFETKIVEEMGILSQPQWEKARKENPELKNHYPSKPENTYSNFKWPGYQIRIKKEDMVSEEVFTKDIVEEMGILSQTQWEKARKENPELKSRYPSSPEKIYPNFKWPRGRIKLKKEVDMISKEVFEKKIVKEKGILSQRQWAKARKENPELKNLYPYWPERVYPNFKWPGERNFVSEEVFIKKVEEKGIYSQTQWRKARKENPELKNRYPSQPEKIYPNFKWSRYQIRIKKEDMVSEEVFIKEIVEEEGILSQTEWKKARKENPELKSRYPYNPEKTYLNFKWPGYQIKIKKEDMVSEEVFIKKVEEMGIHSQEQWAKARKENPELKNRYPSSPEKIYPHFKWPRYQIKIKKEDMVSEEVFIKDIVEEMGIHSQKQWDKTRKENPELKNRYPSRPEKIYPNFKWPGGKTRIEKLVSKEVFIKDIVEEMGIHSQKQWAKAREENPELKNHYPYWPEKIYSNFKWPRARNFVSEEVFIKKVEEMGIHSQEQWAKARKENPELINRYPSRPKKIYPNFKWIGKKNFVSEEVFIKEIVEEMGIPSQRQWDKTRKENPELKNRYPSRPKKIYPNFKWSGEKNIFQENHLQEGFVSKEDFVQHVVDMMGVSSQPEWVQLRIEHPELQKNYPLWPEKVYKDFLWFVWKNNPANIF